MVEWPAIVRYWESETWRYHRRRKLNCSHVRATHQKLYLARERNQRGFKISSSYYLFKCRSGIVISIIIAGNEKYHPLEGAVT